MSLETIEFAEKWSYIQSGITKLKQYVEGHPGHSYTNDDIMRLYTTVYDLCNYRRRHYSGVLYYKYGEVIEEYVNSTVVPALSDKYDDGYMLLQELVKRWSIHKNMVSKLVIIFTYLERHFIPRKSLLSLREVGLTCFRDLVYVKLQRKVKEAVLALVVKERDGEDIDKALMKDVRDFHVEIGMGKVEIYEQEFDSFILEGTSSYFSRKASRWIQEYSFFDYILKSEECLKRITHCPYSSSVPKLVTQVEYELFLASENQLLDKKHSEFSEIKRGLEKIANIFTQHAADADGEDAATNQAAIRKVIELHDKYIVYITKYFENQTIFLKALQEAFKIFCSNAVAGSSLSAESLATLCERIIISKKWASEELSDEAIEKVVSFLAFVSDDKDIFLELYRKKLARRLMLNRGASSAHERRIITKLKQQFGVQFTLKMERMVTDLTLSIDNQNSFDEYVANNLAAKPGIDMTVTLLTTGVWPSYKTFDVNLPSEMVKCVEAFKGFYETNMKRRKLTWIHSLGRCHINGKFDQKPIELIVSTHQAAVLLLFNTRDKMDYTDIQTQLNVSHEDLVWLLHSLSCGKYKILIKEPATETVSKTDVFEFNSKFTARTRRVNIPLPHIDERKNVIQDVNNNRRYVIDTSLVRIMKREKVLEQKQLVSECVEQLSRMFKPDIEAIKRRIEELIIRDYLERDKENPTMLRYLA